MSVVAAASNHSFFALTGWKWIHFGDSQWCSFLLLLGTMVVIGPLGSVWLHTGSLSHHKLSLRQATTLYGYCAGCALLLTLVPYLGWLTAIVHCNVLLYVILINVCEVPRSKAIRILLNMFVLMLAAYAVMLFATFVLDWVEYARS